MRIAAALVAIALTAPLLAEARPADGPVPSPQTIDAERVRQLAEEARQQADVIRQQAEVVRQDAEVRRLAALPVPVGAQVKVGGNDQSYSSGHSALQQRQYERAITEFDRAVVRLSPRADGALYWRAFAQYRLGQAELALSSLTTLRRDFGQSRYLADAKVLEAEIKRTAGRPANPNAGNEDEIKLLAIQGVQRSAQAVPVLEGVLTSVNSLVVKKRALGALASIDDPRARTALLGYAKGSGNPDLQIEAIRLLGNRREAPLPDADLRALYAGSRDTSVRLAVVSALASQENADALVTLARAETEVDLKREIVRRLSDLAPRSKVAADFLTGVLQ